jgi:protein-serine/threonine kinase
MDDYENYENGGLLHDRYKKISDISEGSYGMVSVAKDTKRADKVVAIKYIYPVDYKKKSTGKSSRPLSSPAKLRSPSANEHSIKPSKQSILKSLKDEAQKEIRIHEILGIHPNISTLYDNFESFLVLEFCTRGDLYEAIQNGNGPSTSQDVKDVFLQIVNALEYCHSHGVYHRDLKPENILIAEDWSIKLCDWGLATTTQIITNPDEFDIGSERYMAPELFDNELQKYDASKIDLWSIGIILLTLVFHKNPFQVANYSDKRFIQFVNNREALFDIFSTMSGEMFSVLRFSLNIDPTNRDLGSIKSELKLLKYFTIDEEYWGSEMDDEEEEELEESADSDYEDNRFYNREETSKEPYISPVKNMEIPAIDFSEPKPESNELESMYQSNENPSNKPSKPTVRIDDFPIPHNHRADALLSTNSSLKPIPIGGSNVKFIRNTRKPFNVASYNQSHSSKFSGSYRNFNREDFFTPRSIFNHYMDKYGEQRFNNSDRTNNGSYHSHHHSNNSGNRKYNDNWKRNGKKPKRRNKKKYRQVNDGRGMESGGTNNITFTGNGYLGDSFDRFNGFDRFNRRKSTLHTLKVRRNVASTVNTITSTSVGTAMNGTVPTLNPPLPTGNSSIQYGSAGKYIPPFLRSPNYNKSPEIEPLSEEIDKLNLNRDLDEVFHLEDDFEFPPVSDVQEVVVAPEPQDPLFKRFFCKDGYQDESHEISHARLGNGTTNHNHGKRPTVMNRRPLSTGHSLYDVSTLSSSATPSGKYVPPFRRGSHCSAIQSAKHKPRRAANDDCINNGFSASDVSSSVPSDGDWMKFKKDWSDYD